jgi:hypothetical protein
MRLADRIDASYGATTAASASSQASTSDANAAPSTRRTTWRPSVDCGSSTAPSNDHVESRQGITPLRQASLPVVIV